MCQTPAVGFRDRTATGVGLGRFADFEKHAMPGYRRHTYSWDLELVRTVERLSNSRHEYITPIALNRAFR